MRWGLVLGAGGATGHGFHCGVLAALADVLGLEAPDAAIIVGTSAGAGVGALVRAGLDGRDLAARATGAPLSAKGAAVLAKVGAPVAADPFPPRVNNTRPASWQGALAVMSRPWQARIGTLAAALMPEGAGSTDVIAEPFRRVFGDAWPDEPLWLCAVDVDTGRRMVFNRNMAGLDVGTAVAASCAIPGWFAPVSVGNARYVDGGVWSPTNADVLANEGLDLVVVSSPMSSTAPPTLGGGRIDAPMRMLHQFYGQAEAAWVRARSRRHTDGQARRATHVVTIEPTHDDINVMGRNPMDWRRRAPTVAQVRASVAERLRTGDLAGAFASG